MLSYQLFFPWGQTNLSFSRHESTTGMKVLCRYRKKALKDNKIQKSIIYNAKVGNTELKYFWRLLTFAIPTESGGFGKLISPNGFQFYYEWFHDHRWARGWVVGGSYPTRKNFLALLPTRKNQGGVGPRVGRPAEKNFLTPRRSHFLGQNVPP